MANIDQLLVVFRAASVATDDGDDGGNDEQQQQQPTERNELLWSLFASWERWYANASDIYPLKASKKYYDAEYEYMCGLRQQLIDIESNEDLVLTNDVDNAILFHRVLEQVIEFHQFQPWHYKQTQKQNISTQFVDQVRRVRIYDDRSLHAYIQKLRRFAQQCADLQETLASGAVTGRTLSMRETKALLAQLDAYLPKRHRPVESTPFYRPCLKLGDDDNAEKYKTAVRKGVENVVWPAYSMLHAFIHREYLPKARSGGGLHYLSDGLQMYDACLRKFTTDADVNANMIHEMGLEEVRILKDAMYAHLIEHFNEPADAPYTKLVAKYTKLYKWGDDDDDDPVMAYYESLNNVRDRLHKFFTAECIPCVPLLVTSYRKYPGASAVYQHKKQPVLKVNLDHASDRHKCSVIASSLHEGIGHHFQRCRARLLKNLPIFRRNAISTCGNIGFTEGWAVYMEYFGNEMDAYDHDPVAKLGHYNLVLIRAARMVVDTGMHARKWTRDHAKRYLRKLVLHSDYEIASEIDRMIGNPGKAAAYMYGCRFIRDMANKYRDHPKFTWPVFHEQVLCNGSVPLPFLRRHMKQFFE